MPKISVIVPVYKVPKKYLMRCIDSIKAQSLIDIEIILVNDGSPDECGAILDSYAYDDKRIKVVHKENGGLSSARNAGFKNSTGEFITFVDGDDWIEYDMCQTMYEIAVKNNVQLVMCGMSKDYNYSSIKYNYKLQEGKIYEGSECKLLQQQLLMYNSNIATAYAKLIDKKILIDNNIVHDEKLKQGAEGIEFNIRLFEKIQSATFINKPFYHYIYNDSSISSSFDETNSNLVILCFEKIESLVSKSENKRNLEPWLYNRILYILITSAISGFFNPKSDMPYKVKKVKYKKYLDEPIFQRTLKYNNQKNLSFARRVVLFLIKYKLFFLINLLAKIRKLQKDNM